MVKDFHYLIATNMKDKMKIMNKLNKTQGQSLQLV